MIHRLKFAHQILPLTILTLLLITGAGRANASVITSLSDNFDSENGGSPAAYYTAFANWTVSSGNIDLIGNGSADKYPGNGLYIDLNGSQVGSLTTKNFFAPGTYEITIDAMGTIYSNYYDGYRLAFGTNSYTSPTGNLGTNLSITEIWTITSNSTMTIADSGKSGSGWIGATLLSVSVKALDQSTIPEPSSLALLGLSLIFLITFKRKLRLRLGFL